MELHPVLTHFPIAAVLFAVLGEAIRVRTKWTACADGAILGILLAGALFALASFLTGLDAADDASVAFRVPDDAIAAHYNWARLTLVLLPVAALFKFAGMIGSHGKRYLAAAYAALLLCALAATLLTGYYGGELVFRHGAGVFATDVK